MLYDRLNSFLDWTIQIENRFRECDHPFSRRSLEISRWVSWKCKLCFMDSMQCWTIESIATTSVPTGESWWCQLSCLLTTHIVRDAQKYDVKVVVETLVYFRPFLVYERMINHACQNYLCFCDFIKTCMRNIVSGAQLDSLAPQPERNTQLT